MVDILMATYNGEAYAGEQIESLQKQTYTDWRLWVHDDGSTDKTVAVVQSYANKDKRIHVVDDRVKGLGVARNFLHLLQYADEEYIMFCDQDDVWLPEKLEKMVKAISSRDQSKAQAVYSNAYLWSKKRGIIADRNTLTYPTTLKQLLFLNTGIQGAAGIFNQKTRELLSVPLRHYAMHDHALLLCAMTMGEVSYIDEPLMYYRQHEHNVTGNAPGSMQKKCLQQWENRHIPLVSRDHLEGLRAFYEVWQDKLKEEDRETIELFLSLPEKSFIKRMHLTARHGFKLFDSRALLLLKMCVRRYI